MNFFIAYFRGIWLALRKIKMWILLYFINFIFAILAAIPLSNLIKEKVGWSLAPERMLQGFDYTIYQDFMNKYGDAVSIVMGQSRLIFILYFFLSIFLVGGILTVFKVHEERFSFQDFWSGCTFYFWRMFRLTIYFLLIQVVIFGVFSTLIYYGKFQNGIDGVSSEAEWINAIKFMLPIYLIVASLFFLIQDYAKIHVVHKNPNWLFFSFWRSFSIVFNNFLKTYPLYLLNMITFAIIFSAFWYFRFSNDMNNPTAIALTFVIGQAFIFARIGTKLLNLGSATLMYQSIMKEELEEPLSDHDIAAAQMFSEGETLVFIEDEEKQSDSEEE